MNKRGQVLVTFILLLPLFFMLFALVIDVGFIFVQKRSIDHNVKDAIAYGFEHKEENIKEKLNQLLATNIDHLEINQISVTDQDIEINVMKHQNSLFSFIFQIKKYQITSHYKGYQRGDQLIIERK